jgi:HK97 family phage portal protein
MGLFDRMRSLFGAEPRARVLPGIPLNDPVLVEWFGGAATIAGASVTPENVLKIPAVGACVRLLADTIATVPLDFYERRSPEERVKVNEDPRYRVLQRPNPWQTGNDFRRWQVQQLLTRGNAAARMISDGAGVVQQLVPMPWSRVAGPYVANGSWWYQYAPRSGAVQTLSASEVLHLKGPWSNEDGTCSLSPVDLYRETFGLALVQNEYLSRFFANSAVPKGAIEIPATLGDEAAKQLRDSYERRHKGLENAHKIAILDGGMKFHELGAGNKDAQVLELYNATAGDISGRIFGIPPHMIGMVENTTSWGTGIEQQALGFIMFVVRPWYVGIEAAMNNALLSEEARQRYYYEHNADGLLRGDFKSRMDGFAVMIQWGLATPNEIRRIMNMPPIDGGDECLKPLAYAPASIIKDVLLKNPIAAARALRLLTTVEELPNAA